MITDGCGAHLEAILPHVGVYGGRNNLRWFSELQYTHDHGRTPEEMKARLIAFGRMNELDTSGVV